MHFIINQEVNGALFLPLWKYPWTHILFFKTLWLIIEEFAFEFLLCPATTCGVFYYNRNSIVALFIGSCSIMESASLFRTWF